MEWNPTGSGLLYKDIPIPIMKILDSKEDYDVYTDEWKQEENRSGYVVTTI